MKITIIIPTYNESGNIDNLITTLQKVIEKIEDDCKILFIDANSPDKTSELIKKHMKDNKNIELIIEKAKRGLGAAYVQAMEYAFSNMKSDAIITFDADLSHDSEILPKIVEQLKLGAKYVGASRYRKGGGIPQEWGIHRKLLSYGGNFFIRMLYFGSGLTDFTSGYKAFTKDIYSEIKERIKGHSGYTFAIATNLEPIRAGFKAIEIPYKFKDREKGKSKMGSEYFSNALKFVIKLRFLDFLNSRFGKVFMAGGVGAISQLLSYAVLIEPAIEKANILNLPSDFIVLGAGFFPKFLLSQFLAIEVGIFVSFYINNSWAFLDNQLKGRMFFRRYVKNHAVVAGAILIQLGIAQGFASLFGSDFLFLKLLYQVVGILTGLIWNFYFYKKIIWKVKK